MNPPTQEIQHTTKQPMTVRQLLESDQFKSQVARVLPKHLTVERFARVAATTVMRSPLLEKCDQVSLFNALMTLSQLGIEADGRRAHLIPFFNSKRNCYECQLIIDYKGLAELVMRSGIVSYLHADTVCVNDDFVYNKGQIERHTIDFRNPRGPAYCVYAICRFKDGTEKAEVMSTSDVESIRKRSKAGQGGPWVTDWNEMAKKTVFRRLSKWLPLSPEFRDAVEADADAIDIESEKVELPKSFTPPQLPEQSEQLPPQPKRRPGRPSTKAPEPQESMEEIPPASEAEPGEPLDHSPEEPPVAAPEEEGVQTPQQLLASQIVDAGYSWDELVAWNHESGFVQTDLSEKPGFDFLSTKDAMKFLGSIVGLLKQLKAKKGVK